MPKKRQESGHGTTPDHVYEFGKKVGYGFSKLINPNNSFLLGGK